MRLPGLVLIGACLAVILVSAQQRSPANRPWPPGLQQVSSESPVLTPADALKTFYMPPGYHLELVASEPLVEAPVALDWDLRGRLWVVEMPGFMADLRGSNEHDPIGRVVVLEDTDHDGVMDKRTVFADGLILARSIKVLDRGVLVAEPPSVWFMRDTNGDLKADERQLVTGSFGNFNGDPQNNANGFYWAMDNRMYTAGVTEIQFRLKDGVFEIQKTLERGEWGVAQDDAGRTYRNTNESALHVDLVPTYYYARNPNLLRTRGSYERIEEDDGNVIWPVRPNPGTNRAYQIGIDRPDGTLNRFTSVCAPLIYRGDRLPAELYGNAFVAEPAANVVSRLIIEDTGEGLHARRAYEKGEFIASTDERFRPVFISDAPDGTMYIADMYRGIIEHRISVTEYLRDQILSRKLDQTTGLGRIYRVMHDATRRAPSDPFASATTPQLVQALSSPNGWRRDTAQRLLVERGARAAAPSLAQLATAAKDWRTRLHALWTLDGLDAIDVPTLEKALADDSREVRVSAVRISERWLAQPDHPIASAVMKRLDDPDWQVREQLAASLGTLPQDAREAALVSLLDRYADDPVVMDAALSGVRGREAAVLERVMKSRKP